jgi:hypothetical protein
MVMTIVTTNVLSVDVDSIRTSREADILTLHVLRARVSEAERNYYLTEIEKKRRGPDPLRSSRRVPN